jgi:glutamate--cysteine ligase
MADLNRLSPLIENSNDLIEALSKGNKPKSDWRIGTEHEKFVFYIADNSQVPYEGQNGIKALLKRPEKNPAGCLCWIKGH